MAPFSGISGRKIQLGLDFCQPVGTDPDLSGHFTLFP